MGVYTTPIMPKRKSATIKSTGKSTSKSTGKPTQCTFCSIAFPSKTKLFHHLNSGECQPALAAGYNAKANVHSVALYIGHDGTDVNFLRVLRHSLANVLQTMNINVPWDESDPLSYRWTTTTQTKDCFLLEDNVPRVEEMVALSLPFANHDLLLQHLNHALPHNMHAWRIVGPLPKGSHLHADTDCSKRRMECLLPWTLLCPQGPISPHQQNLQPHSMHQFLMGFCKSTPTASSPLSLLGKLSTHGKDQLVREVFHFLCRPEKLQLIAMKRMKRTFQAFQGYRSLHNCTLNDGLLPQNSSIQQKIERFAMKGVVMIKDVGACIVVSCAAEKYFPTGAMRSLLGLAVAVYRGMLPSESIPILLRNFSEKMKKNDARQTAAKREQAQEQQQKHMGEDNKKDKKDYDQESRFTTNSYRRPVPANVGLMVSDGYSSSLKNTTADVGGSVILNVAHKVSVPVNCLMFTECHCAYWERKYRRSLITIDGTLEGTKVYDVRTGYRRSLLDKIGQWWSTDQNESHFETAFESGVASVRSQVIKLMSLTSSSSSSSSLSFKSKPDSLAPVQYREVLRRLRLLRNSRTWPETSSGRARLIQQDDGESIDEKDKDDRKNMNETNMNEKNMNEKNKTDVFMSKTESIDDETMVANKNGSFTIGFMPGNAVTPKANTLFPSLMREIFDLETAIMNGRPGSACCAVNCNAKFRPHKDSGAGNGQQVSLIVGLGEYDGGQLGVEGTVHDIRYSPLEFDGWKQRHWTLPFQGERFSLVWFSPNGCGPNDTGKCLSNSATVAETAINNAAVPNYIQGFVTLRNGVKLPMMGLGTFQLKGNVLKHLIRHAVSSTSTSSLESTEPTRSGSRSSVPLLIDTAEIYSNHHSIRSALANMNRSDYFLVTKLSPKCMSSEEDVYRAFHTSSLELLGEEDGVLDGYLMHWVAPHGSSATAVEENNEARIQCWLAMEKLYWKGLVRVIGVSNFTVKHLQLLLNDVRVSVIPFVNQVEVHPLYPQEELRTYCIEQGIQIQAYASFGQSKLLQHEKIMEVASSCNMTAAQLLLLWALQHQSLPVIPRTSSIAHLEENLLVTKIARSSSAMKTLDAVHTRQKFAWDSVNF